MRDRSLLGTRPGLPKEDMDITVVCRGDDVHAPGDEDGLNELKDVME